jgi:small subunit ribosomal protein S3
MKGEVYGKRELSPLVGMSKGQTAGKGGKPEGGKKPRRRK